MALEPTDSGDLWYEYAASQLLAKDRAGYSGTCAYMMDRCQPAGLMRSYLVARACTLAPDSTENLEHPHLLALSELDRSRNEFWALTERAALQVRTKRYRDAVWHAEMSLVVDGSPGRAVLNWLWLSLGHQKMGNPNEARRWLAKASNWLNQQDGRMPLDLPSCSCTFTTGSKPTFCDGRQRHFFGSRGGCPSALWGDRCAPGECSPKAPE